MVDVSIEFLAGVAVTVFLALIFFAVIVLWDVALALRSVGDKIDKLEDNLDDDLKDIGYSLDTISKNPGSGGSGTQLHLNSGTISPGPAHTQETQPQGEGQGQGQSAQNRGEQVGQSTQAQNGPHPQQDQSGRDDSTGVHSESGEPTSDPPAGDDPQSVSESQAVAEADAESEPESDSDQDAAVEPDSETEAEANTPNTTAEHDADPTATEQHPRATANRGRFSTSPDRTPWYATPLDRDAIAAANAGPTIAGELEAGTPPDEEIDEPSVIAVGPDGAHAEPGPGDRERSEPASQPESDEGHPDVTDSAIDETGKSISPQRSEESDDESDDSDDPETTESSASGSESESGFDFSDENRMQPQTRSETKTDMETLEWDETDEQSLESVDTAEGDPDTEANDSSESEPTEIPEIDFTDLVEESGATEDEVSVDDALETMNDEAPSLSLSSHGFDVTAEADEESAVLRFEFDPDTVEINGSTKRLLRYQMRSFADQESTPDGEVTIDGNTIIIELPSADGNAIDRWGEAAVTIIDRTLYLSDNST